MCRSGSGLAAVTVDTAMVRSAIREERKLLLHYADAEGKPSQRIIRPIGVVYYVEVMHTSSAGASCARIFAASRPIASPTQKITVTNASREKGRNCAWRGRKARMRRRGSRFALSERRAYPRPQRANPTGRRTDTQTGRVSA